MGVDPNRHPPRPLVDMQPHGHRRARFRDQKDAMMRFRGDHVMGLSSCGMRRNTTQRGTAKMKNWIACAAALALLATCGSSKEATAAMAAMQITDGKSGTVHFASKSGSGDKIT